MNRRPVRTVPLPLALLVVLAAGAAGVLSPVLRDQPAPSPAAGSGSVGLPELLGPALACPPDTAVVVEQTVPDPAPADGPGTRLVVGRCDAGAGNPPSGVFVVSQRPDGPRIDRVLVAPQADLVVPRLSVDGDRVQLSAGGFSGPDVPRCCPDRTVVRTWRTAEGALVPVSA